MRLLLPLASSILLGAPALAQWSANPATNTLAVDRAGEQTQPKLAPTSDGGCYLSWFDNDPGGTPAFGYDVFLQRFDSAGIEQWAHNGVRVADLGLSSTTDYDLGVDASGNALVTFQDDRFGGTQITAARVDPSGALLWGANGIQLTSTLDFVANPKVVGTTDGGIVVAWLQGSTVHVQRLNASGVPQWAPEVVLTPVTGSYATGDLDAAESGRCILSLVHQTGGFSSPKHLLAQKFHAAGTAQWGVAPVAVFDGGSLQFGNYPQFEPDGSGGAVFSWYSASPALECFAQRLDTNGAEQFAHNGVAVSTLAGRVRVAPAVSYDAATQSTYVSWVEANSVQSQFGVGAQKFDAAGARQWGASGKTLVALATSAIAEVEALLLGATFVSTWTSAPAFGQDVARATLLDAAGTTLVAPFAFSSTPAVKYRFESALSSYGFGVLAWRDERGADPHVYLQDLLPDGSLGRLAATASRNGNGTNVVCYTSLATARLGHNWSVQVSHAHHPGATSTVVFGRTAAINGPTLAFGQVLIAGPLLFTHGMLSGGSADVHTLAVPIAISLVGLTAATQAVISGGGVELTNALDVTVGL
ncbi:MAG: hypothetical protein EXS08_14240 [Planctomycetes bacterium]|nr:hypothetical protein [Planctomycetota bacterium]